MAEAALAELLDDPVLLPVTAMLLVDGGAAELNPPEWIEKLRSQVILPSAAGDDPRPDPQMLQSPTLLSTDQNGWIELTTDGEHVGGGVDDVNSCLQVSYSPSFTLKISSARIPWASRCTASAVSASGASTKQKSLPVLSSYQYLI